MIKVLIVDDEIIIRTGIRTSIDWESMGMVIVGEASNGKEGFEKILSLEPHIVITDVRMPVMDGLEFTKLLKEERPDIRVVIISGYDDFKYAREALRMGVNEYLLKPIGADELIKIMLDQCEDIRRELDIHNQDKMLKNIFNENLSFMQARFINSIVKGEINELSNILEKSKELNVDLSGDEYQVIIIDIDDFLLITENLSNKEKDQLKMLIGNIAAEILKNDTNSTVCLSEYDYLLSVINVKDSNRYYLNKIYEEIKDCVKKQQGLTVTIGISNVYQNVNDIPKAYNEALFTLRNKIFKGKDKIINIMDVENTQLISTTNYTFKEEKEIINYLKIMETDKLNQIFDEMYQDFIISHTDHEEIKKICLRLITVAMSQLDEMGAYQEKYNGKAFNPYIEIEKYETLEDIKVWMKNIFGTFIEGIQSSKNDKFNGIVKVAIQYMDEHYYEDIGVEHIAAITYVTPNYFSRVFKKETGKSFTEWLNNVRVDKAKNLLKDLKFRVYEIADKVGYNDYKIFTHNFKKYAGCTPKEYRDNILQMDSKVK